MDKNTEYEVGQPLVVELENETLIGDLKLISADGRMVELTNVRDFNTGYVYTSSQCLARPLIKSIKRCKRSESPTTSASSSVVEQPTNSQHAPKEDLVNITSNEIDKIQSVIAGATYIYQTDQKYHKAIADIKRQSTIGLHVEPTQFGRHNRTSLLTVSTFQNVYVFDLISLGKIFKELKEILQSQHLKKIVHYSNKVADSLKFQHGVELTGVFDTFVAHCLISKQRAPICFDECATQYFNIPQNYFTGENELQKDIYKRPLTQIRVEMVSKKAIFLCKLYEHMLHGIMLKNFYQQCSDFSTTFSSNKDNVEIVMLMKPNFVHGTDIIKNEEWADLIERKLNLTSTLNDD